MDELGNLLREARESKGLTLAEAQEVTRINTKYLEALENGQYEILPSNSHVRGYLRNYARFLDLDPKPVLDRYELSKGDRQVAAVPSNNGEISKDDPIPLRPDQPFFDPVNVELSGTSKRSSGSLQRWIIILALIATIALIGTRIYSFLSDGGSSEDLTSGIQETVNNLTGGGEDTATPTADPDLIPGAGEVVTSTNRNEAIQLPTATATRPTLPATLDTIQLRIDITERTWMRVTIDGEVVFQGLARKGDEPYEWTAAEEAQLLAGNAAGIFVTINEVPLGKLGGRAEVIDETWETTSG